MHCQGHPLASPKREAAGYDMYQIVQYVRAIFHVLNVKRNLRSSTVREITIYSLPKGWRLSMIVFMLVL